MSSSPSKYNNDQLHEVAKEHAKKAVEHDLAKDFGQAYFHYMEASQALLALKQRIESSTSPNQSALLSINNKLTEYISRAEKLKSFSNEENNGSPTSNSLKNQIEEIFDLMSDAVNVDKAGDKQKAFDMYTKAVESFLKIKDKIKLQKSNQSVYSQLESKIKIALERAEKLKFLLAKDDDIQFPSIPHDEQINVNQLEDLNQDVDNNDENSCYTFSATSSTSSAPSFSKEEIDVLRHGSRINGRDYVPFFSEIDTKNEKFHNFPIPFTDKDGKLQLSKSQRERYHEWVRPGEIYETPTMLLTGNMSSFSVKQTCISDCSFVSSLTVIAQYERKFNKNLLSKIIYPQNKKGEPVYNSSGKYMISLELNGCLRKIIIDDYLPIDKHNNLLCSVTTNRGEMWVSLLEKAYLKVMGGYDFPGSNSNIDLHALTSWIPERLAIHGDHTDFRPELDFERMFERFHGGDVLITIATGPMSKELEDRTGLVATHAYAVLDIRKFRNQKLFQLKNPWSHLRWKGNFSEYDINNWTDELKKCLNYDPQLASNFDNGIFWIDYDSLMKFYDVFYLSWNPALFPYTSCCHRKWSAHEGPIKDRYILGDNPQYVIRIIKPNTSSVKKCSTWILLTRHITDKADFAENQHYIALVIYKNNGKRIYYPMEPEPYKEGIRINSPHYLVKLVDDFNNSSLIYNLVVCQYEKSTSIYYTLRAFSTSPFTINELKEPYNPKYTKKITGQWKGLSAGGCSNQETYKNNPIYQVTLSNSDSNNHLKIELKGPQQYSVGFDLICQNSSLESNPYRHTSTGDFRKGFCVLPLNSLPGGSYNIRPSTYLPKQEGPFILEIESNREFQLNQIQ